METDAQNKVPQGQAIYGGAVLTSKVAVHMLGFVSFCSTYRRSRQ